MSYRILLLIFFLFTCDLIYAQPGDPGGDTDIPVPIAGIEILIGIGSAFGVSRFLKGHKKK